VRRRYSHLRRHRLAAATGAYVCFEDEAGQNLRPPKARTSAPARPDPVVRVFGKGSGRVSMAGPGMPEARRADPPVLPGPHSPREQKASAARCPKETTST
jgi:hypothetical protein